MKTAVVSRSAIAGNLNIPASKSHSQRLLFMSLLYPASVRLRGIGQSEDEANVLRLIQELGAVVEQKKDDEMIVSGVFNPDLMHTIDCGESGLAARIFSCLAGWSDHEVTLTGKRSLTGRDMYSLKATLNACGISCLLNEGKLPAQIKGPFLFHDHLKINAEDTSQILSGLMMSLGSLWNKPLQIEVAGLCSKPYIDLTMEVLQQFACRISHEDYRIFKLLPREVSILSDLDITAESDWSSAAFSMVAAAIQGEVTCQGLNWHSSQADKAIVEILRSAGAKVEFAANSLRVTAADKLLAFRAKLYDSPDLFPSLSILAAFASGVSELEGVSRLSTKESDRSVSIRALLTTMQIAHEVRNDTLLIHGGVPKGGEVQVFGDHRIAMAAAVAGCFTDEPMVIPDADVVAKSYPSFFDHLKLLGASVTLS